MEPDEFSIMPSSINKSNSPSKAFIILFGSFNGVSPVLFTEVVVIGNPNILQRLGPKL